MLWKIALGIYSATAMPADLDALFSKVSPACAERCAERRIKRLLNESEELRQALAEAQHFWMNNQPSTLTYERQEPSPKKDK